MDYPVNSLDFSDDTFEGSAAHQEAHSREGRDHIHEIASPFGRVYFGFMESTIYDQRCFCERPFVTFTTGT